MNYALLRYTLESSLKCRMSNTNKSCGTYERILSHMWESHTLLRYTLESCLKCRVPNTNRWFGTYEWILSHMWTSHIHERVMWHIWMSHVAHMNAKSRHVAHMNAKSRARFVGVMWHISHIHERVMWHIWTRFVGIHFSCWNPFICATWLQHILYAKSRVSLLWMNHVTHVNEYLCTFCKVRYWVATISRMLKKIGLSAEYRSLL